VERRSATGWTCPDAKDFSCSAPCASKDRPARTIRSLRTSSRSEAARLGLPPAPVFRRIALGVQSSLEAVGLTAAVAGALARQGISANMVAAFHHDHVFVPADRAEEALACLLDLRGGARPGR
jgi:hypothetical protein